MALALMVTISREAPSVGHTIDCALCPDRPLQPNTFWFNGAGNDRLQSGRLNPATSSLLAGKHGGANALQRALQMRLCLFSSLEPNTVIFTCKFPQSILTSIITTSSR